MIPISCSLNDAYDISVDERKMQGKKGYAEMMFVWVRNNENKLYT